MLIYSRSIHVYETDLMGIVHHSNYLRFCEEARVQWCKKFVDQSSEVEMTNAGFEYGDIYGLTVVETKVQHKSPLKYNDTFHIEMQSQISGATLTFQYKITNGKNLCALGETIHCSVNKDLKPKRLSKKLFEAVKKENKWTETWL